MQHSENNSRKKGMVKIWIHLLDAKQTKFLIIMFILLIRLYDCTDFKSKWTSKIKRILDERHFFLIFFNICRIIMEM